MRNARFLALVFLTTALAKSGSTLGADADALKILQAKCTRCHGGQDTEAGLDLTSVEAIQDGSESGSVVNVAMAESGRLFELIKSGDMPPDGEPSLSAKERSTLLSWIKQNNSRLATQKNVSLGKVLPLLQLRCTACHGTRKQEGQLDLRTYDSIMKGGKSGRVVVPGDPASSLILKKIHSGEMPPKRRLVEVSVKPMEPSEVEVLTRWIEQGAKRGNPIAYWKASGITEKDRSFWSYQRPKRSLLPKILEPSRANNGIDFFILKRLEQRGLSLHLPASRRTLIRRLWLDMLGLPPTADEIARFVNDKRPDAWARIVEDVLAKPQYGERWGGYWLDLAGYSDSEGIQHSDPIRPEVWRYRDYVIRSFNDDKPYARFLKEQIAGDELFDYRAASEITSEMYDGLVATGFLRQSEDASFFGITNFVPDRLEIIDDVIEVLSSSVMGMTIRCARCHDHKFDPVKQGDYYQLAAILKGAYDENDWLVPTRQKAAPGVKDRYLAYVSSTEKNAWQANEDRITKAVQEVSKKRANLKAKFERQVVQNRAAVSKIDGDQLLAAWDSPASDRSSEQKLLIEKQSKLFDIKREDLLKIEEFKQTDATLEAEIKRLESQRKSQPLIRALWDRGEPSPTYILNRGNYLTPGLRVHAGIPSVLNQTNVPLPGYDPVSFKRVKKTGRRLAFAEWLTSPSHPLVSRVMVNRIWKHHFKQGIVTTLADFGVAGTRPTHPELLDWLAVEFIESGWSIKAIHRLILNSATYQQSSTVTEVAQQNDPENRLLSRMPLQRMEAEVLRDSLIAIAGRLDHRQYGPADSISKRADGLVTSNSKNGTWRRSIYVLRRRTERVTILENFDRPRMSPNCVQRGVSTVTPQALHLLNNQTVHELCESIAKKTYTPTASVQAQYNRLFELVAGRPATNEEMVTLMELRSQMTAEWQQTKKLDLEEARRRSWINICHAVVNSAAFLYID